MNNVYQLNNYTKRQIIGGVTTLFLYIFSFRIYGPITSSYICLFFCISSLATITGRAAFIGYFKDFYIRGILFFQVLLISLGLIVSIFHQSYDYSYIKILIAQIVHLLLGVCCIYYLLYSCKFTTTLIIKLIVIVFCIQSFIELAASATPALATFVAKFNNAEDMQEGYSGVRGLALSSGTTWSLGLTYGFIFFLFTKEYLIKKITFKNCIIWLILIIGTFFAGRTGLVGACIALIYMLCTSNHSILKGLNFLLKIILITMLIIFAIYSFFPQYYEFLFKYILPFALAPVDNYLKGDGFRTGSTDVLFTMWDRSMTDSELFLGSGYFIGDDGAYYKHTDVGVLRNIFYWGVFCYILLIIYQLFMLWPIFKKKEFRNMMFFAVVYIALAEYKAITIGLNKMLFSVILIIGFFCHNSIINFKNNFVCYNNREN